MLRGKPNSVIDALCGVGGFTVQFAKYCKVIAIDIDPKKISYAQQNAEVYGVSENIAFIEADFLQVAHGQRADLTIISPDYVNSSDAFDVKNFRPNISDLIKASLECSQNILIYLPPFVDAHILAIMFHDIEDIQPFVEISLLFDGSHLKAVSCLIGPIVKLPYKDVNLAISSRLGLLGEQKDYLKQIIDQVSIKTLMNFVNDTEKSTKDLKSKPKIFMEQVLKNTEIKLENLPVLFKGDDFQEVLNIFRENGEFVSEKEKEGETVLEIKGKRIEGSLQIVEYLRSRTINMQFLSGNDLYFG